MKKLIFTITLLFFSIFVFAETFYIKNFDVKIEVNEKGYFDVVETLDIFFTVSNDEKGIQEAVKTIKQYQPERIIIEATGRLEMPFIMACAKANLPFVIANPIHIKRFAGAIGQRAKTDKLDAKLIAHYGEAIQPTLSALKPETMQTMSDLVARRNQLLTMQTMEKNRLQILPKSVAMSIKPILSVIKKQVEKIEKKFKVFPLVGQQLKNIDNKAQSTILF